MNAGIVGQGASPIGMPLPLLGRASPVPMPYGKRGDPYWSNVSLLLTFAGPHGSRTFNDSSPQSLAITANGTAAIVGRNGRFGNSYEATATTNYLSFPATNFGFGTGEFTVECWYLRTTSTMANSAFVQFLQPTNHVSGGNRFNMYVQSDNRLVCSVFGTELAASSALTWNLNQWYHLACTRTGASTIRLFRDGSQVATNTTRSNNFASDTTYKVQPDNPGHFVSELRVTKGVSRYPAAFAPPTAPFPIGYQ